jgi:hypothetical protein
MTLADASNLLSGALVDLELDSGDQNTLMLIEANSKQDILFSIILFIVVIVSTTCAGIFGPPLLQEDSSRSLLNRDSRKNVITLRIPGVSPQNQFLMIKLTFELSNPLPEISTHHVTFNYVIVFYDANREIRRAYETFSEDIAFQPRSDTSDEILFLFDRFIHYDHVDIRLDITEFGAITDAVISWACGEVTHLKFQLWIRCVFGVASTATAIIFWMRLRAKAFRRWTLEQKLTLGLNLFSIIGVNPLFPLYLQFPTFLQEILNSFMFRVFTSYVFVFILLVLDHLRNHSSRMLFATKMIFFSVQLIVEMAYPIVYNGWDVLGVEVVPRPLVIFVTTVRVSMYAVFVVWFAVLAVLTYVQLDSTEHFKVLSYISVFLIVIVITLADPLLSKIPLFKNSSGMFTLHFSALHSLVLLMIFSHWPYEFESEEPYANPDTAEKSNIIHDLVDSNDGDS